MAQQSNRPEPPGHPPELDRLMLFSQDSVVLNDGELFWQAREAAPLLGDSARLLPVAEAGGRAYLATEIESVEDLESRSLRSLLFSETDAKLALLSKARQILNWYHTHQYCGICGAATEMHGSERILECTACGCQFFPRINPCVIVLVTRGEEILLARSSRFRTGFYSCLAGFMEVGETPEQTIHREVREEVGLEVENIRYVESQSWPFPSQLMLGFLADYRSGEIVPEPAEIEDAGWFHVNELKPVPSAEVSVAGRLIQGYVQSVRDAL